MDKKKNYYQYDSTARDYSVAQPYRKPEPKHKPTRKVKVAPRPKASKALVATCSASILAFFVASVVCVTSYSTLRSKESQLNKLKNEKVAIMNDITKAESERTKKTNLEDIRQKAEEMGMRKPLQHQIHSIQIEENSYTDYNN